MKKKRSLSKVLFLSAAVVAVGFMMFVPPVPAQEEVASAIRRYKDREASTGYYEGYEVKPHRRISFVEIPNNNQGMFRYRPSPENSRDQSRLADSHQGLHAYLNRRCEGCHIEQTNNLHTKRANLTCRQCHGGEPIASLGHYYSPMNPIRRHAYVCAKCHEGSTASFAGYVIHEPNPALISTYKSFPVLAISFWAMVVIAVGTFVLFLPHTVMWGIRELFIKKEE